jgi:predicted nucleic acid-binding protein
LIVFDASAIVGAALKVDSVPESALLRAEETDVFALSAAVDAEISDMLARPKFVRAIPSERRELVMAILRGIGFDHCIAESVSITASGRSS